MAYLSALKRKKVLTHPSKWRNLRRIGIGENVLKKKNIN
jgi:hypothetical protein